MAILLIMPFPALYISNNTNIDLTKPPYEKRNKQEPVSVSYSSVILKTICSQKIKKIDNYISFKKKIRNLFLEEPLYSIEEFQVKCKN